jgi:hypothetical protein
VGDDVGVRGVELERRRHVQAETKLAGFHRRKVVARVRSISMGCACAALDRANR